MVYGTYGNLAYDEYQAAPARKQARHSSDVRVVRSGGAVQTQTPTLWATAAKMAAIFLVVVAALSFVRIILTNEAVTTMIQSDGISAQISEARAEGITLEMEQSVLSNPSAIKDQAKKLSMAAPAEVGSIALTPDVVAIEEGHTLSLSETIKNVVELAK